MITQGTVWIPRQLAAEKSMAFYLFLFLKWTEHAYGRKLMHVFQTAGKK